MTPQHTAVQVTRGGTVLSSLSLVLLEWNWRGLVVYKYATQCTNVSEQRRNGGTCKYFGNAKQVPKCPEHEEYAMALAPVYVWNVNGVHIQTNKCIWWVLPSYKEISFEAQKPCFQKEIVLSGSCWLSLMYFYMHVMTTCPTQSTSLDLLVHSDLDIQAML